MEALLAARRDKPSADPNARLLLAAGANRDVQWQFLQPVQWASLRAKGSHSALDQGRYHACVEALTNAGAILRRIPPGRGLQDDGSIAQLDRTVNRLQAPRSPEIHRRRRKGISPRKVVAGEASSSESTWDGWPWVKHSLLKALLAKNAHATTLLAAYPALGHLDMALRRKLCTTPKGSKCPKKLPAAVVDSISLRPGVIFGQELAARAGAKRRRDGSHASASSNSKPAVKFGMQRAAAPKAEATLLGAALRRRVPHFLSVDFERNPDFDDYYKYYFCELLLALKCVDVEGKPRELCFVRWLDTANPQEPDGVPLQTKYVYYTGNSSLTYAVVDAEAVQYRAPLVEPPSMEPNPPIGSTRRYWILNHDVYGVF